MHLGESLKTRVQFSAGPQTVSSNPALTNTILKSRKTRTTAVMQIGEAR